MLAEPYSRIRRRYVRTKLHYYKHHFAQAVDPTLALISVLDEVAMAVALLPKRTKAQLARQWMVPNFGCTALPIARSRGKGPNLTRAPTLIMIRSFGTHRPFGLAGVPEFVPVCAQYY